MQKFSTSMHGRGRSRRSELGNSGDLGRRHQHHAPSRRRPPGLTGFVTTGADMTGMTVTVAFNGGADNSFAWATTGAASGGVTTPLWSLTLNGDSFSAPWQFAFLNPECRSFS